MNKKASEQAQSENRFLMIMIALVLLMAVPTAFSLLKPPATSSVKVAEKRAPASLDTVSPAITTFEGGSASASLLNLDCKRKTLKEETNANYVRLVGFPCKNAEDLEIVNKTNGFSASVIFIKGHKFTTDFIDLSVGENKLQIIETQENGNKVARDFTVFRRSPASLKN